MIDDMEEVNKALEQLKQLSEIEEVENTVVETINALPDISPTPVAEPETQFGKAIEQVKLNVLEEASHEDTQFVNKVKTTLKKATVKHTEVEEKRADFEKQKVEFASEVLQAEQQKNEHRAIEDKWANRERKRTYHYNGVKPIMRFVGIEEPLNLFLLYLLTSILSPFFLASKLLKGTLGALIAGACDEDRPKTVKGFLWTLIAVIAVLIIAVVIYLFLKWQRII